MSLWFEATVASRDYPKPLLGLVPELDLTAPLFHASPADLMSLVHASSYSYQTGLLIPASITASENGRDLIIRSLISNPISAENFQFSTMFLHCMHPNRDTLPTKIWKRPAEMLLPFSSRIYLVSARSEKKQ